MRRILILFLFFSSNVAAEIIASDGYFTYTYYENGTRFIFGGGDDTPSSYFCGGATPSVKYHAGFRDYKCGDTLFTHYYERSSSCPEGQVVSSDGVMCEAPQNYCDSSAVLDAIQDEQTSCALKAEAIGSRYEVGKTCIENLDDHTKGSLTTSCTLLDEPYCGSSEYSVDVKTAYDACFASGDVQYFSHMCDAPTRTMTPTCKLADAPETATPTTPTSDTDYQDSFNDNTDNLVGGTIDGSEVEQDFPTDTNGGGSTAPAIGSPEHQDAVCRQRFSASVCDDKINNTSDGSTVTNPDAAPGDAISERLATDVLNGVSNHYENSTKEVLGDFADSFTSLEKSTPLGGDKLDSFVAAYKSLFPSASSCTPLKISLPFNSFTVTCEFSDKFKTIFAFIIYFYTIQSLISIVFTSIKPKPVS